MTQHSSIPIGPCGGRLGGAPACLYEHPARCAGPLGQYLRADIEHGARLYEENCTRCHGAGGEMIVGIILRDGQFCNVSTDPETMLVLTTGILGTAAPKNGGVSR